MTVEKRKREQVSRARPHAGGCPKLSVSHLVESFQFDFAKLAMAGLWFASFLFLFLICIIWHSQLHWTATLCPRQKKKGSRTAEERCCVSLPSHSCLLFSSIESIFAAIYLLLCSSCTQQKNLLFLFKPALDQLDPFVLKSSAFNLLALLFL